MKTLLRILTFLPLLIIFACNNSNTSSYDSSSIGISPNYESSNQKFHSDSRNTGGGETNVIERKIIKEGNITFETLNLEKTKNALLEKVKNLGGYISNENAYTYDNKTEYSVTIKIPAENFDSLLAMLATDAAKLDNKNMFLMDVTEEYIDVESRIKTKKELENRYLELLKQATKVEELLNIERELAVLRGDIESFEGRLKFLNSQITMSSLTVTFYEKNSIGFGFMHKFKSALKKGWTNFLWFLIGAANLWIFILLTIFAIFGIRRYRRRKLNK